MQYDVIIVGAGPIGLAHAWGIKAINPTLRVLVVEKYAEYQRKHTLVMQPYQLKQLMDITGTTRNVSLSNLYNDLLDDNHIRTITLEQVFKSVSQELGVEIQYKTITAENIFDELISSYPEARLIIGADGTHSQVSRSFFSESNQIKHEIDYVLQLRYEATGNSRKVIGTMPFLHMMIQHELIANEYVGHFDSKTNSIPVTMQAMITKDEFNTLKLATSKDPIRLYQHEEHATQLPHNLLSFINRYLANKRNHGLQIDNNSVRVSVNEAPATRANKIFTLHDNRIILLAGDAGLGLSYFKGLNAGLESTGKLLSILTPWLKNMDTLTTGFEHYQTWFNTFANSKIDEVKAYSSRNIHVPWSTIQFIHFALESSYASSVASSRVIEDMAESSFRASTTSLGWLGNLWSFFQPSISSTGSVTNDHHSASKQSQSQLN